MIPSLVFIDSQDNKTCINEGALHVLNLLADLKANDKLSRKCSEFKCHALARTYNVKWKVPLLQNRS